MELIKAKEAKQIADEHNNVHNEQIKMLNEEIKDAAERGMRVCEVNRKLLPSVVDELDNAGYAIYVWKEDMKISYLLRW